MAAAEQPAYEPHRLIPVHTVVPGRARFKTQALYRRDSLKSQLERRLSQLDGVRSVGINVLTCTVLVHYDPAQSHSQIQRVLEGELEELPAVAARPQRRGSLLQRFKAPTQPPDESKARESSTSERDKSPPAARLDHQGQQHRNRQGEPWHTLEPQALARRLEVDPRQGLTRREAETRLARYGANVLPRPEGRSRLSLLLQQFASPPVLLLGASAVVSVATSGLVEAVSILGVVVINAVIGYYTERQSERIISALNPQVSHEVRVLRDGRLTRLPSERLVVGDVLEFNAGAYIPADTRLIEAQRLSIDESALTGESVPVDKRADTTLEEDIPLGERINMAYTGTVVAGGWGRALVVGTGLNSEIGRIQTLAAGARPPATPMETQLEQLGTRLVWLSSGICLAVFAVGLLRGYGWLPMLESAITLAVAAVPEGLPMVATTTLALGIREMRRHQVLVRQLSAVETLGSVEVFCFDKTGTLTLNRMTAVTLQLGLTPVRIEGEGMMAEDRPVALTDSEGGRRLCQVIALCSEVELNGGDDRLELEGSATEKALLELSLKAGLDIKGLRRARPRLALQDRAERRPYMATLHQTDGEGYLMAVKGSPDHVLELCNRWLDGDEVRELDRDTRERVTRENERMAGDALRVLGMAYRVVEEAPEEGMTPLEELIWLGQVGMMDPLRQGMDVLLERFHRAGIDTAMITGDQSATAYAIARKLDLAGGRPVEILDSLRLDKLEPEVLSGVVQGVQVFARVSPAHKLQIVQALQGAGKVVAMTGDGINDGPALRAADLGVAMGQGGSEVAQSLADVVLGDDDLKTMEVAVRHGRATYDNVRKAIRFLLATNLSEIEVMLAGIALGAGQPLNPMQLLWINLISDIFPGLALALEKPEAEIMDRPPRDPRAPVINRRDLQRLGVESGVISAGTLASFGYALLRYGPGPRAGSQAFMTLTLGQLLHAVSCRSETHTPLDRERPASNPYLGAALGLSLAAQALTVLVPGLRRLLDTVLPGPLDTLMMAAGAIGPLLINESTKKPAGPPRKPAGPADKS